jgi:hypothetical protein
VSDREYELTRAGITGDHRHSQHLAHVVEQVFRPVLDGKKDETRAAVARLSGEQRSVALALALDVLEALAARTPGLAEQVEGLWGDYLYAGWPDYVVRLVPGTGPAATDGEAPW